MGLYSGANPDVVKTELDKLFFSVFNRTVMPNMADVDQDDVFRQDSANNSAVNTENMADGGMWEAKTEQQDVPESTPATESARSFTVASYDQALYISKDYFDDEQWGSVAKMVEAMANKGYLTSRDNGFEVYRGGFATYTTNDSAYIFSDSHTNINGDTVDNLLTAALSPAALKSGVKMLAEQKDQAGDIVGHDARCLLVPNALYDYAVEITESALLADTTDNNVNAFSAKYNLYVKQSNRLSAASGGSDTAWFLLSPDHMLTRWIRQSIITRIIDWQYDSKNRYCYKGNFREVYGCPSYEGICGSTGLT